MLIERMNLFLRITKLAQMSQLLSFRWDSKFTRFKLLNIKRISQAQSNCRLHTAVTMIVVLQTIFWMQNLRNHSIVSKTIVGICVPCLIVLNYMVRICNHHASELALCINGFFQFHQVHEAGKIKKIIFTVKYVN